MAEAIMNERGKGRFSAYSAGSHPSGTVRPEALRELDNAGIPTTGLRSKSWDEFAKPDSAKMDFIFTVCGNAANETCPVWPGHPATAQWGIPDPAAVKGTDDEIQSAYRQAFVRLDERIGLFLSLPFASIDHLALKTELDNIGRR